MGIIIFIHRAKKRYF